MEKNPTEHAASHRSIDYSHSNRSADRLAERVIESRELFGESKEIAIEHDGAFYRLKITKQGKLILNK